MRRTPVSSSNLASVGYDPGEHILEVEFLSGSVYQYFNVPEQVYRGLMSASSHGSYFGEYIRMSYQYRQVL
jgi:hypothetical protein